MESDVITSKDEVYETGVLAQITSNVYTKDSETGVETLTTVLYPHKRIRIDELVPPPENTKDAGVSKAKVEDVSEGGLTRTLETDESNKKEIIEGVVGEKEGDEPKKAVTAEEETASPHTATEIIKATEDDISWRKKRKTQQRS
ncbi:unnamed protein product [Ambrosiozyma monospora]|uniref:Unnamed protein product n=1 Tax=Ambrosiozyma monospora TaxID=43982 RepID=A0ACB5UAJ3_AMBMO|nr:unnamed protein product [Ambrosiozyma monospora]